MFIYKGGMIGRPMVLMTKTRERNQVLRGNLIFLAFLRQEDRVRICCGNRDSLVLNATRR